MRTLLLCVVAVLLCGGVACAWDLPIQGVDVGFIQWHPADRDKDTSLKAVASLKVFKADLAPDCPTNLSEVLPWLKGSFRVDIIGDLKGSPANTLGVSGAGASVSAKVGAVLGIPVKAGVGYVNGDGLGYYVGLTKAIL
jgi:hypothetical protein